MLNILLCCLLVIACSVREGFGAAQFGDPPSGSTIADFEGTDNFTTITCNIANDQGTRISTQWSIANFRGVPSSQIINDNLAPELFSFSGDPIPAVPNLDFRNRLTILTLTPELDRVTIFCGSGGNREQAYVNIRNYRPPILRDNFLVRIEEGDENIPVDLRLDQNPAAFPELTGFIWNVNGELLTYLPRTYSSVNFSTIRRNHAGNYTVFAVSYFLDDSTTQVGNDTGSFYLDVLYPPSFARKGPSERFVLLGDPLSLVCGTGLDSNPQATITWTASNTTIITVNIGRYTLENGPEIVRLNFSTTMMSDNGVWRCNVMVTSDRYVVIGGQLLLQSDALIGSISQDIQLTVIATPGPPSIPVVENIGATWACVCWDAPVMADSLISHYQIRACNLNSSAESNNLKATTNMITNDTFYNVTGLVPGTTYELTVVAVSQGGNIIAESQPSGPIINTTGVTVPAVTCNASLSANSVVMVTWSYIHTGGLPLNKVSVSYTDENEFIISRPIAVSNISVDTTRITVPDLEEGFRYNFNVTAQNRLGFTSTLCGLMIPISDQSATVNTAAIVGGVVGGLVILGFIIGFVSLLMILSIRRKVMHWHDHNLMLLALC